METEPADSHESTPPANNAEEPVPAVPTSETTPVWAHTVPVEPAEGSAEVPSEEEEALPALPMQKGDPDWSKTETPAASNGEGKKATPAWATTVPTSPGEPIDEPAPGKAAAATGSAPTVDSEATEPPATEATQPPAEASTVPPAEASTAPPAEASTVPPAQAGPTAVPEPPPEEAPTTQPLRSVAGDALKTWPPAAEAAPAPPEETDIWPPEPPTERAMPAWPPPSELARRAKGGNSEEEPATPPQAIPSWPESFGLPADPAVTPPTITPAPAKPASAPSPPPPAPAPVKPPPPARQPDLPPAAAASARPAAPPAPAAPTPSAAPPAPPPPAPAAPVAPSSQTPSRPAWAPGPVAPAAPTPPKALEAEPMQVPAWAPRVPLAGEPGKPTWFSPQEAIPHATAQAIVPPMPAPAAEPAPAPPIVGGKLPVAPIPTPAAPAQAGTARPTWEVVEQHGKTDKNARVSTGPTAEDRSYAEWFAWAKRGGAPASACHAAAQGAFKALSSGKDVMTAVQWATAAMAQPPENVPYARQTYCAWFSLANIDLNLDQHRAHLFAGAAIQALDAGQDPSGAHAAGLAAAGIR